LDEIIEKADRLMYFVKNNGGLSIELQRVSIKTFDQQAPKPTALAANRHTAVILVANRFFQISAQWADYPELRQLKPNP